MSRGSVSLRAMYMLTSALLNITITMKYGSLNICCPSHHQANMKSVKTSAWILRPGTWVELFFQSVRTPAHCHRHFQDRDLQPSTTRTRLSSGDLQYPSIRTEPAQIPERHPMNGSMSFKCSSYCCFIAIEAMHADSNEQRDTYYMNNCRTIETKRHK